MAYKKRIADELLKEWIESTGCVLVEGSKWCGKTTTPPLRSVDYCDKSQFPSPTFHPQTS